MTGLLFYSRYTHTMTQKEIATKLEAIEDAYYENDENAEQAIAELKALHQSLVSDPKAHAIFLRSAAGVCGGCYLPYLMWVALAQYTQDEAHRELIFHLMESFTNSDFSEELQQQLKPLVVVYFYKEKSFELDKLHSKVINRAHPDVVAYFDTMKTFLEKNSKAVEAYRKKFGMLMSSFPDFERFDLPVSQLEEELG